MKDKSQSNFSTIIQTFDLFLLILFFFYFLRIQYSYIDNTTNTMETWKLIDIFKTHYKALLILVLSWCLIAYYVSTYKVMRSDKALGFMSKLFKQFVFFSIIIFAVSGLKERVLFVNDIAVYYLLTLISSLFLFRFVLYLYFNYLNKNGKNLVNVSFFGVNKNTFKLIEVLRERRDYGYNIHGIISNKINFELKDNLILKLEVDELEAYLVDNKIQKIFISQMASFTKVYMDTLNEVCVKRHVEVIFIPHSEYTDFTRLEISYIDTLPVLRVKHFPLDISVNQILKSFFDKFFALMVCIFILSWLFPIIALLIYLDSGGPILFIQKRNGLNGQQFGCFKFRTMIQCETNSIVATEKNDSRITRIGTFLRKTSMDELPQFLNVLKGDMSIVGPRPHMITQDMYYTEVIQKYSMRHYVKPGITGLAQVRGYRGAIDSDYDMEKRIRTDLYYIRNWSFLLDIQIIYQTVVLVFKGDDNAI